MLTHLDTHTDLALDPRFKRWAEVARNTIQYEGHLQHRMAQLGWLDVELSWLDAEYLKMFGIGVPTSPPARLMDFKIGTVSELWLMAAYEAVRTIDERLGEDRIGGKYSVPAKSKLKEAKQALNRVRIPLAKLEPSGAFKATDLKSAGRVVKTNHKGTGWMVAQGTGGVIYRSELSDQLLESLETLCKEVHWDRRPWPTD